MLEDIFFTPASPSFSGSRCYWMSVGVVIGILVGAVPGLTATMGVALVIPFTFTMEPLPALGLLAGVHAQRRLLWWCDTRPPGIALRIPGTPGAITTAWDGYPMAQRRGWPATRFCSHLRRVLGSGRHDRRRARADHLAPPLANFASPLARPRFLGQHVGSRGVRARARARRAARRRRAAAASWPPASDCCWAPSASTA